MRIDPSAHGPERAHADDAAFDLHAMEPARIGPGERVAVGTGIAIAIPAGHAGLVLPRSGRALRDGLTLANSPGLIDPGYRGELRVLLLNADRSEPIGIEVGDRIAQLLVVEAAMLEPLEVDSLEPTVRGEGGFGSTGD